jgi:hypothetical protein
MTIDYFFKERMFSSLLFFKIFMTPYKKNVKTIHRDKAEIKRIHNGILGRDDQA